MKTVFFFQPRQKLKTEEPIISELCYEGTHSIDYECDYFLWFRTNSTPSNETYLTINFQMQKCITAQRHHPIYCATVEIVFYNHIALPFFMLLLFREYWFEWLERCKREALVMVDLGEKQQIGKVITMHFWQVSYITTHVWPMINSNCHWI